MKKVLIYVTAAAFVSQLGACALAVEKKEHAEADGKPEKKTTGWIFHRNAAKPTAAGQWAYIQELIQAGHTNKAAAECDMLVRKWHDSSEAPQAQLLYARLLDENGSYDDAFEQYQYLVNWYAGTFKHDEVLEREFRIANHVLGSKRWFVLDSYETALPMFEKILRNGANWSKAPQVQFTIGHILEKLDRIDDAVKAFELVHMRYPESEYAPDAAYRRAAALYSLAESATRDETAQRDALSCLTMTLRDYPNADLARDARQQQEKLKNRLADMYFDRAAFYDRIAGKPQAAVIAYTDFVRSFPKSDRTQAVQDRIDELNNSLEKKNDK
ncbi:MAG: hypothetical protein C0404_05675 [Verrucomicrobia bacterium]|nr:hypothetical protein [Verrucomicrobiota bacterium]